MFEWLRIVRVIYGSCISHNRGERVKSLWTALVNARAVQMAEPIPWQRHVPWEGEYEWSTVEPDGLRWNSYFWVVATRKGWLPYPWFEGKRPVFAPAERVASLQEAVCLLESVYGLDF